MRSVAFVMVVALGAAPTGGGLSPKTPYEERLDDSVKVAGTTVVGLTRGAIDGRLSLDHLAVDVPSDASGALCAAVVSRDGRYNAWRTYAVRRGTGSPADLQIRSQRQQHGELQGYGNADVAVRLQLKPDCDGPAQGTFLAARWAVPSSDDVVSVAINVKLSRATAQLVAADGRRTPVAPVACSSISAGARTAFDHTCVLHVPPSVASSVRSLDLTIIGTTGSRRAESFPVRLTS